MNDKLIEVARLLEAAARRMRRHRGGWTNLQVQILQLAIQEALKIISTDGFQLRDTSDNSQAPTTQKQYEAIGAASAMTLTSPTLSATGGKLFVKRPYPLGERQVRSDDG